jgi:hypothetical protein
MRSFIIDGGPGNFRVTGTGSRTKPAIGRDGFATRVEAEAWIENQREIEAREGKPCASEDGSV